MSMAARAVSSRAVSSMSLAGITASPSERPPDVVHESRLDLRDHGLAHVARAARALAARELAPLLEVGVGGLEALLHGDRIDQRLEALAELQRHLPAVVGHLDGGRDLLPGDDLPARHLTRPP